MCRVLKVSKSGFYAWRERPPSKRARQDIVLTETIREIHSASRGTYGSPRVHAELRDEHQIRISRKRVARLMQQAGLVGVHRRKNRAKPKRDPKRPVFKDLVDRFFLTSAPDRLWVADITQHQTLEGWLYIAVVLDVFSRKVVGWSFAKTLEAELVVSAIEMAVANRNPTAETVHHSDHGSQYTSLVFGRALEHAGILGSMGTVGDALDNAVAESFFATLQTELLDSKSWASRAELRTAVFEFIEVFYNRHRRHSSLDYLSPVAFERRYATQPSDQESAILETVQ